MSNLKIYISVDMEGITSVIDWDETGVDSKSADYQYFRKIMTQEVNAAIEGTLEKGANEIIVRDAHNSARNIIPDQLNENAKLLRAWASTPYGMMDGIDKSFNAVLFIGYHARAMTAAGTLAHTMSGKILNLKMNGIKLPEFGWNALIAGYYDVPVIFISGDDLICGQAKELIPEVETVAVKQGIGEANLNLHPKKAQKLINSGVRDALNRLDQFQPFKMQPPFTIEVEYKKTQLANKAAWYPGAERKNDYCVAYTSDKFFECMRFFYLAH